MAERVHKISILSFLSIIIFSNLCFPQPLVLSEVKTYDQLVHAVRAARAASQQRIEQAVEQEKVREAWETGKLIDHHILLNKKRAKYGERILEQLARDLGTSKTELSFMLQFARAYPIISPAKQLSWSHYRELLSLNDSKEREEVTRQAVEQGWGRDRVREEVQKRQSRTRPSSEKLESMPGKLNIYQVVRAAEGPYKGKLAFDLGFSNYYEMGSMSGLKEGDLVRAIIRKKSKNGLADSYRFEKNTDFSKGDFTAVPLRSNSVLVN